MARPMSSQEWRAFAASGARTAVLATVRKDGRAHAAPVWFLVDGGDLVFMTGGDTVKGRALRRTGRAAMVVDDSTPPFSFVSVEGTVVLDDDVEAILPWLVRISQRYVGPADAEAYGRRDATSGGLLVRLTPNSVVALSDLTG